MELRTRFLHAATHTVPGLQPGGTEHQLPANPETEYAAEGHGTYRARFTSDDDWYAELGRITGPMDGTAPTTPRPEGEADWFVVVPTCRCAR